MRGGSFELVVVNQRLRQTDQSEHPEALTGDHGHLPQVGEQATISWLVRSVRPANARTGRLASDGNRWKGALRFSDLELVDRSKCVQGEIGQRSNAGRFSFRRPDDRCVLLVRRLREARNVGAAPGLRHQRLTVHA